MAEIDPEKLERELASMREMIASDPEVLAHFDANGDGQIDGAEWEAVVRLVTLRIRREAEEATRARAIIERDDNVHQGEQDVGEEAPLEPAARVFQNEVVPHVRSMAEPDLPTNASLFETRRLILRPGSRGFLGPDAWRGYFVHNYKDTLIGELTIRQGRVRTDAGKFPLYIDVVDIASGRTLSLRQKKSGFRKPLSAYDETGEVLAHAHWSNTWGRPTIDVWWQGQRGMARPPLLDLQTFHVRDGGKNPVARIEPSWLGSLSLLPKGDAQTCITLLVDPTPDLTLALLAASIVAEWTARAEVEEVGPGRIAWGVIGDLLD